MLSWFPDKLPQKRKAISASCPELTARFVKEAAIGKKEMLADIDFMDVNVRQENINNVPGNPVQIQLGVVPSYGLTVHKTQALSIRHIVRGILEGVFAQGQVYVLISRVTDPNNFELLGVPPIDLLDLVVIAWREAGLDIVECLRKCVTVTNEFQYIESQERIKDKIKPRRTEATLIPVKNKTLTEILNPQPKCSVVLHKLMEWIDECDLASQTGKPKPECLDKDGQPIIPTDDDNLWWLTEMSARKTEEKDAKADEDGPPDEEVEKNDITDDESMSSEVGDIPEEQPYIGFFERQKLDLCGMHALNNGLGFQFCKEHDMAFALEDYLISAKHDGLHEIRSMHAISSGWYSSEVMSHAINTASMSKSGTVRYVMELKPLLADPNVIHTAVGAIVNKDNTHWVAIRSIGGKIWYYDSKAKQPTRMTQNEYVSFVNTRKAAYPIRFADDMSQSINESPVLPMISSLSSESL